MSAFGSFRCRIPPAPLPCSAGTRVAQEVRVRADEAELHEVRDQDFLARCWALFQHVGGGVGKQLPRHREEIAESERGVRFPHYMVFFI